MTDTPETVERVACDPGMMSAQPCPTNDKLNELRLIAFKSNDKGDRDALLYALLKAWSDGDLIARELTAAQPSVDTTQRRIEDANAAALVAVQVIISDWLDEVEALSGGKSDE